MDFKVVTANCEQLLEFNNDTNELQWIYNEKKQYLDRLLHWNELPKPIISIENKPRYIFLQEVVKPNTLDNKNWYDMDDDIKNNIIENELEKLKLFIRSFEKEFIDYVEKRDYKVFSHPNSRLVTLVRKDFYGKLYKAKIIESDLFEKYFIQKPFRLGLNSLVKLKKRYKSYTKDEERNNERNRRVFTKISDVNPDLIKDMKEKSEPRLYKSAKQPRKFTERVLEKLHAPIFMKDIIRSLVNERMCIVYLENDDKNEINVLVNIHVLVNYTNYTNQSNDINILDILPDLEKYNIFDRRNEAEEIYLDYTTYYEIAETYLEFLHEFLKELNSREAYRRWGELQEKKVNFIIGGDFNRAIIPSTHDKYSIFRNVNNLRNAANNNVVRTYFAKNTTDHDWEDHMYSAINILINLYKDNSFPDIRPNKMRKEFYMYEQERTFRERIVPDIINNNFSREIKKKLLKRYYNFWYKLDIVSGNSNNLFGMKRHFQRCFYSETFDNILYKFADNDYTYIERNILENEDLPVTLRSEALPITRAQYDSIMSLDDKGLFLKDALYSLVFNNVGFPDNSDEVEAAIIILLDMVRYYYFHSGYKVKTGLPYVGPKLGVDEYGDDVVLPPRPYYSDHAPIIATFRTNSVITEGEEESKTDLAFEGEEESKNG